MSIQDTKSTFHSTAYMLKKQEEQTKNFDLTLSKLKPEKIQKIREEQMASQKVYSVPTFPKMEKRPLTR